MSEHTTHPTGAESTPRTPLDDDMETDRDLYRAEVARLTERNRALEAALRIITEHEVVFRDYTGTDYRTCAYCREPIEALHHSHADDCEWAVARRALTDTEAPHDG